MRGLKASTLISPETNDTAKIPYFVPYPGPSTFAYLLQLTYFSQHVLHRTHLAIRANHGPKEVGGSLRRRRAIGIFHLLDAVLEYG